MDKGKATGVTSLKFRVLLSGGHLNDGLDTTWKWQELEVEPVETFGNPTTALNYDSQTLGIATLSIVSSYVSLCSILK